MSHKTRSILKKITVAIRVKEGFTLSEMLMTVLIISLVVILLGGGLFVVKNAYEKVTARAEAQTILSTAVTKVVDEFRYAQNVEPEDVHNEGYCTFKSNLSGCRIWFESDDSRGILKCRGTGENGKIQLLTGKTMAEGLVPTMTYEYDGDVFNAKISVIKDSKIFASQIIYIKPINND